MSLGSGSFGSRGNGRRQPLTEINMIPLIDVMLVLLIVFMITAPLLTHAVRIDLPKASSHVDQPLPEHIDLALRANGEIWWQGEAVTREELVSRVRRAASQEPAPAVHLRADAGTAYENVAQVMALVARNGLTRIGFVSTPETP